MNIHSRQTFYYLPFFSYGIRFMYASFGSANLPIKFKTAHKLFNVFIPDPLIKYIKVFDAEVHIW
jgi:hypothetical protein